MDFANLTFVGLMTIGFVNVLSWFYPTLDSKYKFTAAVAVAFVLSFVPSDLGNIIFTHAKTALEVAAASSGVYKLSQNVKG